MGLDMYLKRRVNMYKFDKQLPIVLTNEYGESIKIDECSIIIQEIAYWRKANAIHKWFVDNCNNGNEDCDAQDLFVSRNSLLDLLKDCKDVLKHKNKASEILPTCSGFFFGSTDYDDCYIDDIKLTIKQIENVLKNYKDDYFFYEGNW